MTQRFFLISHLDWNGGFPLHIYHNKTFSITVHLNYVHMGILAKNASLQTNNKKTSRQNQAERHSK